MDPIKLHKDDEKFAIPVQHVVRGGFLTRGVAALPPGSSRTTTWSSMGSLLRSIGDKEYTIGVSYRPDGERKRVSHQYPIRIVEFVGHKYQPDDVDVSLASIADTLWRIEGGQSRVRVVDDAGTGETEMERIAKLRKRR